MRQSQIEIGLLFASWTHGDMLVPSKTWTEQLEAWLADIELVDDVGQKPPNTGSAPRRLIRVRGQLCGKGKDESAVVFTLLCRGSTA